MINSWVLSITPRGVNARRLRLSSVINFTATVSNVAQTTAPMREAIAIITTLGHASRAQAPTRAET